MFVRTSRIKRGKKTYEYGQLVESVRRESDGTPVHRVIASLGRLDSLDVQNLRAALDASRKGLPVVLAVAKRRKNPPKPSANLQFLDLVVLVELWREWGLDALLRRLIPQDGADVDACDVIASLAIQRCVAPDSKLAATRWFPRTALPELLGIQVGQFNNTRVHRVLDQLEAVTTKIMGRLPGLYRERDGAFAALFMDVSDAHFVGHGSKLAERAKTKKGFVAHKIGIVLLCNELGYPLRWDIVPGARHDSLTMASMFQDISGFAWLGGTPVVVDRAMGKTASLRKMLSTGVRFLTALTVTEFHSYASTLRWEEITELSVSDDDQVAVSEAAERAEGMGMEKVSDTLFVLDHGVVDKNVDIPDDPTPTLFDLDTEDLPAKAMRLCREINEAVAKGKYRSFNAAGASLGIKRGLVGKYRALSKLPDDVQSSIIDGNASGATLAQLIDVSRMENATEQRKAFETLIVIKSPVRRLGRGQSNDDGRLQVRVVVYFNPERFVNQRRSASKRLERVRTFVADLNEKLLRPRSRCSRESILATVDRRLRRDDLLEAFQVTVEDRGSLGRKRYQAVVQLNETEWQRRRCHDGFSVLAAHPALHHTATELANLYRAKDMVEKDFQTIKSLLEVMPVRHRNDEKVRAHVTICMLALLLERTLRDKLKGKYTSGQALELLRSGHLNRYDAGTSSSAYEVTQLDKDQRGILRALQLTHVADDDNVVARIVPR